jgi:hypothetical protein
MVWLLLGCMAMFDAVLPSVGTIPCAKVPPNARLIKMIEGRAKLCQVKKGMTEAEVLKILGETDFRSSDAITQELLYHDYGIGVTFWRGQVSRYGVCRLVLRTATP